MTLNFWTRLPSLATIEVFKHGLIAAFGFKGGTRPHKLKDEGKCPLPLGDGDTPKLTPLTETSSSEVQGPGRACFTETIQKVNGLSKSELTDPEFHA